MNLRQRKAASRTRLKRRRASGTKARRRRRREALYSCATQFELHHAVGVHLGKPQHRPQRSLLPGVPMLPAADIYDCGGEKAPWLLMCIALLSSDAGKSSGTADVYMHVQHTSSFGSVSVSHSNFGSIFPWLRRHCKPTVPCVPRGRDFVRRSARQMCRHMWLLECLQQYFRNEPHAQR